MIIGVPNTKKEKVGPLFVIELESEEITSVRVAREETQHLEGTTHLPGWGGWEVSKKGKDCCWREKGLKLVGKGRNGKTKVAGGFVGRIVVWQWRALLESGPHADILALQPQMKHVWKAGFRWGWCWRVDQVMVGSLCEEGVARNRAFVVIARNQTLLLSWGSNLETGFKLWPIACKKFALANRCFLCQKCEETVDHHLLYFAKMNDVMEATPLFCCIMGEAFLALEYIF